ncbi:MAG: monovalent cation/H(+) antiporter subunit G [Lachnospiraceae bacterium]|nr:monovalent cation/H(+) antiporter subunit G [Lachnospiraceae bacterium]
MILPRLIICIVLLFAGLFMFISATIGVNKFKKPLNRMHAAAMGDTLGLLLILLSLVVWRGLSFVSLKLIIVLVFFWLASPVSGHIIAQMEATTNEDLGEIEVLKQDEDI